MKKNKHPKHPKSRRLQAWYVPTFNGDLRLVPYTSDPKKTVLHIVDPTDAEKIVVSALSGILVDRKWLDQPITKELVAGDVLIDAPLEEVGPVFIAALKPGPAVITAVKFKDGHVEVVEHRPVETQTHPYHDPAALPSPAEATAAPADAPKKEEPSETEKELKAVAKAPGAVAAATVSRPTPCCPDCIPGSIAPAREVLLAFLSPDQHKTWAKERYIVVRGGMTGHRYVIAHRQSELAHRNTRITWDVEDQAVIHFHNSAIPPEEEVLSAMLILQHREDWLRNHATCLTQEDGRIPTRIFENPFGTTMDGVPDAAFTQTVGMYGIMLANGLVPTT